MYLKAKRTRVLGAIAVVIGLQLASCAETARTARQHTYPPEFRYVTRAELTSAMQQLAFHLHQLHYLMRTNEAMGQHRGEIVAHLLGMDQAAARLDNSGWPTNHPMIDMNLPSFRRDIKFAREAIEREPPNYLIASSLTGACVYCHGGR